MGVAGEKPDFDINPPLGAPLLIFSHGYLLKFFPQGGGGWNKSFPLLGELLRAIEPHLPLKLMIS